MLDRSSIVGLPKRSDARGSLGFAEEGQHLPFTPRRAFWIYDVPEGHDRGAHAHKACEQFILALAGSFEVVLRDGLGARSVVLDAPDRGLYVAPMTWCEVRAFSAGAVCLVLASHPYEEADYIRDWDAYRRARGLAA